MFKSKKKSKKRIDISYGYWSEVWSSLLRNKKALIALLFIVLLVIMAIFANLIAPYQMREQDLNNALASPSINHFFGTDELGRDVFSRIIYGIRISLTIGILTSVLSLLMGGTLGVIAGYFKGKIDTIIMRILDMLISIPTILLAIAILASMGSGIVNMTLAISIASVPGFARVVRSSVLSVSEKQFIEASRALGASEFRIIMKRIIPNILSPVIVQVTIGIASSILSAAGLGFIGLGLEPSTAEWGLMLSNGRAYMRDYPFLTIFPGLAIMLTILAFNMLGDGIRDAIDPKMRER